ncbi:Integral membrane protease of the rhomboid family involved in different forms of regulated intramembrane proteolysis [Phaffia rhodozyma]|uniref:Integral membrane protease of the rhomboid family involved in different forms of regulated intramembrane proteolysis n=1 Tax=Phaffia rhodozyma TaxID=264483 RepID=A0A0F7SKV6_PHARH|nr:Integral membrane protease of the rhomboid family involved in different forms of regulated intramembrane proteolysis [Phaffia rhodozyma]
MRSLPFFFPLDQNGSPVSGRSPIVLPTADGTKMLLRTGRSGGRGSYGYTGRGGGGGKRAPWDRLSTKQIVYGIIGANVAVCGVWQIAWMKYSNFNEAPMLVWMRKNWALSLGNLKEGRIWTLFTSTFSHEAPLHLLFNMVIVYQFAPQIISSIGNARFLALYAFAGVAGNVASALTRTIWPKAPGVGASGSMFGLTAFTAAAMPSLELLLFFVVPVNARYALAGWSLFELVSEVYWQGNRTIDGAAHLGGIAAGLIFYRKVMRGKF